MGDRVRIMPKKCHMINLIASSNKLYFKGKVFLGVFHSFSIAVKVRKSNLGKTKPFKFIFRILKS